MILINIVATCNYKFLASANKVGIVHRVVYLIVINAAAPIYYYSSHMSKGLHSEVKTLFKGACINRSYSTWLIHYYKFEPVKLSVYKNVHILMCWCMS